MVSSSFTVITHSSPTLSIAWEMGLPMWVAASGDSDDLHNFGGGGDGFGVEREEFEDTVDSSLGTSAKIQVYSQRQRASQLLNGWRGQWRLSFHHPPLRLSLPEQG